MPENNCQECESNTGLPTVPCEQPSYLDTLCTNLPPMKCNVWTGLPITCLSINTGDSGESVVQKIANALCALEDPTFSNKVRVSSADTTPDYLLTKLIAGSGISIVRTNAGSNETLTFSVSGGFSNTPLILSNTDNSLSIIQSGVSNHSAILNTVVSPNANNALTKLSNGLFVSNLSQNTLKVSPSDTTASTLIDKLIVGSGLTLSTVNSGANEQLRISLTGGQGLSSVSYNGNDNISITGLGTSISPLIFDINISTALNNLLTSDSEGLKVLLSSSNVPVSSTNSITLQNSGTLNAVLRLDPSPSNALSVNAAGVYVKDEEVLTVTSSNSIQLLSSGIFNHELTANLKISSSLGNAATILSDGLYIQNSTDYTAGVGISISGGVITNTLPRIVYSAGSGIDITSNIISAVPYTSGTGITISGNVVTNTSPDQVITLTEGTNVTITGTYPNFTISATGGGGTYTSSNGITLSGSDFRLGGTLTSPTTITRSGSGINLEVANQNASVLSNSISLLGGMSVTATGAESTESIYAGTAGALSFNIGANFIPDINSQHGALSAQVIKEGSGDFVGVLPSILACSTLSGSGNISFLTAIRARHPRVKNSSTFTGSVTSYAGLYIDDTQSGDVYSSIVNKYAIYQKGTDDMVKFFSNNIQLGAIPTFADDTAASSLNQGRLYKTATGQLMIKL